MCVCVCVLVKVWEVNEILWEIFFHYCDVIYAIYTNNK